MNSGILTAPATMAKSSKGMDTRVEFVATSVWVERMETQADRLGMSVGAYIRQAVTERLERDEASQPTPRRRKVE